jgi:hypothetical protein
MWWWDGARWTQPHYGSGQRPAVSNTIAKLAMATQVLLIICAVRSVAAIGMETFGITVVTQYINGNESAGGLLDAYNQMAAVVPILGLVFVVLTGGVWVIWQYRVAKQAPGRTVRSPGWHAGSWFIPLISLWFPYQNIADLWRAVGRSRPSWQILWWWLWIGSSVVILISGRIYTSAEGPEQFRVAMWANLAGEILLLAAAPLAWLIIRGITQGILHRSAGSVPMAG